MGKLLSEKQLKLLKQMSEGWSLLQSTSSLSKRRPHLQKGKDGCGGEVIENIDRRTIYSLSETHGQGFIKYSYSFPNAQWFLTDKGRMYLNEIKDGK